MGCGLTWRDHIEAVRRKCFGGLAKLRRLRDSLPAVTKIQCLCVDYCSVVAMAGVWKGSTKKSVERVQNYAMRLICSEPPRTPSEKLRKRMNWMPLTRRREMFRLALALVHRCVHKQAPSYLVENFQSNESLGHRVTRGVKKLHIGRVRTEIGRKSTSFKGAQDWNLLSESLRDITNTESFRNRLRKHLLS